MKYVEKNLTKHHLIHKPHKWFIAFLSSPIHYAEMYYKNRYHLNFTHARKLFLFDMMLLSSILVLIVSTVVWFNYDPNIDELVYVNISPSKDKMISGDYISFEINYKNESDKKLVSPILSLNLPADFVIEKIEPEEYQTSGTVFELPNLKPNDEGSITIYGWTYGTPDISEFITATLSYRQDSRKIKEEKNVAFIKTLRGSVLNTEVTVSNQILSQGKTPLHVTLENNGEQILSGISLSLPSVAGINFSNIKTDFGEIKNNTWLISELIQKQKINLTADLLSDLKNYQTNINLNFTPRITINNSSIPQKTITKNISISYPKSEIITNWQNNITKIKPGSVAILEMNLKNTGNITLTNAQVEIPLASGLIDATRINKLNLGETIAGSFIINKENLPALEEIKPNDSLKLNIQIPIVSWPQGGTDQVLILNPRLQSGVENIIGSKYEYSTESPSLSIGTQLNLQAESRYYTNEGDQIGRGPLPAQVGQETKYWAMIKIQNATSQVKNLLLTAELPSYVSWTGRSSVSHGQDISYNSNTRQVNWKLSTMTPYTQAGIYFEVSLTPDSSMIGKAPLILKNINITGTDNYIEEIITRTTPDIDISLSNDELGKEKGTVVVQ